jgi:phosphoadenosine phosphosulfate reductase
LLNLAYIEGKSAPDLLEWALAVYRDRFAISTSFQKSGMVLVDLAARTNFPFRVFTLDTGRLPEETLQMVETVRRRYGVTVEMVRPDPAEVDAMVNQHGPDLFYDGVEFRKLCCETRKVRPLARKLREFGAWATGLRRDQAETRAAVRKVAEIDGRLKINPLADWTGEEVEDYIRARGVPVHPLYARGYTSIGCAPCTRPVEPGEDERAGRWWWEQDAKKECGIHFAPDGSVSRVAI